MLCPMKFSSVSLDSIITMKKDGCSDEGMQQAVNEMAECQEEQCAWWVEFKPHPGGACCMTLEQVVKGCSL